MRVPLVHGEGNFGSVDGDPPAAHRYTEAKLTRAAEMLLLSELDQETVDMRDNYTGTKQEPVVLPAQFPNLLVNGTSGIAVGHGDEHPAAQPRRGAAGLRLPHRQPRRHRRPTAGEGEGAGLPARRQDRDRPGDPPQHLRDRPRQRQGAGRVEGRGARAAAAADRRHVDPLRRRQGRARRDRSAASSRRRSCRSCSGSQRVERQGGHADRAGTEGRDRPAPGDGVPVQAHRVAEELLVQRDLPGARRRTAGRWCRGTG